MRQFDNEDHFAFPRGERSHGMTLRDYFAAQALAGILANNSAYYPTENTRQAYEHADAMLRRRDGG